MLIMFLFEVTALIEKQFISPNLFLKILMRDIHTRDWKLAIKRNMLCDRIRHLQQIHQLKLEILFQAKF